MARRGRRREVGYGRSRSSQVRVAPQWRHRDLHHQLARALAMYLLWRLEQAGEATEREAPVSTRHAHQTTNQQARHTDQGGGQ